MTGARQIRSNSYPIVRMPETRKSPGKTLADALAKDPIYQAMLKGNIAWGNISLENNKTRKSPKSRTSSPKNSTRNTAEIKEILDGFKVPDLKLRKGIWENFPVALVALDDGNGVDRYGVAWHNKNLREWTKTKPKSTNERTNYQHWCEVRLLHSVRQYPRQYKILPARNPSQLFVLEMVFRPTDI